LSNTESQQFETDQVYKKIVTLNEMLKSLKGGTADKVLKLPFYPGYNRYKHHDDAVFNC
jgi:hypothetical protein